MIIEGQRYTLLTLYSVFTFDYDRGQICYVLVKTI